MCAHEILFGEDTLLRFVPPKVDCAKIPQKIIGLSLFFEIVVFEYILAIK